MTDQMPDELEINERTYHSFGGTLPFGICSNTYSTNCIRGYTATWRLVGNRLFLVSFMTDTGNSQPAPRDGEDGQAHPLEPDFADWVTDRFCIFDGQAVPTQFETVHPLFRNLSFDRGVLVRDTGWEANPNYAHALRAFPPKPPRVGELSEEEQRVLEEWIRMSAKRP